jgi:hypothetical protein
MKNRKKMKIKEKKGRNKGDSLVYMVIIYTNNSIIGSLAVLKTS